MDPHSEYIQRPETSTRFFIQHQFSLAKIWTPGSSSPPINAPLDAISLIVITAPTWIPTVAISPFFSRRLAPTVLTLHHRLSLAKFATKPTPHLENALPSSFHDTENPEFESRTVPRSMCIATITLHRRCGHSTATSSQCGRGCPFPRRHARSIREIHLVADDMCMVCVLSRSHRRQGEERLRDVHRGGKKVGTASRSSGFWRSVKARIFGRGRREEVVRNGGGPGGGIEAEDWERDAVEEAEGEQWMFVENEGLIMEIEEFL
ncbi:hypothetical protein K440DRAFT_656811 [Wilcoxina mikolae CBS 423.85]|nr:hypothetical protein K440DRAFT_656811 [Wilcoxina mikolae CBS 423.85]